MEAARTLTGTRASFLLVLAAGALAMPGCGSKTDDPESSRDEVGNGAGAGGGAGTDGVGPGGVGPGGAGHAGNESAGGGASGAPSRGFSAIAAGDGSTYAIRDFAAYRLDGGGPVPIAGLGSGVTAITAATEQACAIVDGSAWCWGSFVGNWYNADDHSAPAPVEGLAADVTAISTNVAYNGLDNACAVVGGVVKCWGWSYGAGMNGDEWPLVQVEGLTSGVSAIATAGYHSCAIVDGGAECWGDNSNGQLGDGTTTASSIPVQVQGLTSGVTALGVGQQSSCAIVDGGVWCWGAGAHLLDDGTATDGLGPEQVAGLTSGVTALAVGFSHTCVVVDGGASCWGENHAGQLGDGTTTGSLVPVPVQGLTTGVTAIASGYEHSCAIVDGGVWCWGNDDPTPAKVSGT